MIKLSCKSCGAKLELTEDIDRFSCAHCGSEWLVKRGGGIVSLKSVEEDIKKIVSHTEATAENTSIIANDIKMKQIKEDISQLRDELKKINLNPVKTNPDLNLGNKSSNKIAKMILSLFLSSLVAFGVIRVFSMTKSDNCIGLVVSAIIFFIAYFIFYTLVFKADSKKEDIPKFIPDIKQKAINEQKYFEIKEQIEFLTFKYDEMKEQLY